MDKIEIGKRLQKIRTDKNISQEMVADYLGSTVQRVSSFETGRTRVDLETFIALCLLYGISADKFFSVPANEKALSTAEQSLLQRYRSLDDAGQAQLLDFAGYLVSQHTAHDLGDGVG